VPICGVGNDSRSSHCSAVNTFSNFAASAKYFTTDLDSPDPWQHNDSREGDQMPQQTDKQRSGNITIANLRSEQHYIHLAASGAPVLNVPVRFADEASRVFSTYRDRYQFGASAMKAGCGNIYDSRNCVVGRISYNGRIWDANGKSVECAESPPLPQSPAPTAGHSSRSHVGLRNG
jgi:hypothetical protein